MSDDCPLIKCDSRVSGQGGVGKKVTTEMMRSVRSVEALPGDDMWPVMEVGKRPTVLYGGDPTIVIER